MTLATDNAEPALSQVTRAEAYLWDCEDASDPSTKNTIMQELVPDKFVVK